MYKLYIDLDDEHLHYIVCDSTTDGKWCRTVPLALEGLQESRRGESSDNPHNQSNISLLMEAATVEEILEQYKTWELLNG